MEIYSDVDIDTKEELVYCFKSALDNRWQRVFTVGNQSNSSLEMDETDQHKSRICLINMKLDRGDSWLNAESREKL